jgi:hypothetical protein
MMKLNSTECGAMAFVVRFTLTTGETYHRAFMKLGDARVYFDQVKGAYATHREVKALQEGVSGFLADYALFQTTEQDARRAVDQVKRADARLMDCRDRGAGISN